MDAFHDLPPRQRTGAAPAIVPGTLTPRERRVLIFAPIGNDAPLTASFLARSALLTHPCNGMTDLAGRVAEGCGVILLAEETLNPETMPTLSDALAAQPSWSDIPIIIVTSGSELSQLRLRRLELLGRDTNISLLERPFRAVTLLRLVEVALRTRLRQYQVRDLLGELRRNESRIRRILEQTAVGLAELDLEGKFTLVNDQFCAMVARPRPELLQKRIAEITHPGDAAASMNGREMPGAARAPRNVVEKRYLRPDGGFMWVQEHLSVIRDSVGAPCGLAVASADITDRKAAEELAGRARDEAVAALRAKDDFLAALSHELRTPLNPVLLLASEGASNENYPPAARADFDVIARNVSLEARLFEDLLDLTRITRGKLSLERQPHDLHGSLRDALATVESDLRQKRINLVRDFTAEPVVVLGDSVRLQQIFWNVLNNAVKFTPPSGTIKVSSRTSGAFASIAVTDTGIGLTATELERIFDTFAQGDHAAGPGVHRFGGLGLGLAISKTLIELHGGTIVATSAGRDTGATFTIELPLVHLTPKAPETPRVEAPDSTPRVEARIPRTRVLIVEDHEPTRLALARLLARRKFEVLTAGSVAEALTIASRAPVELMLSDIGLPDGTGYDLMRKLGSTHGLRGIALTGYGQEQDVAQSRAAGFIAHLTKPVDVRALDKALVELTATLGR